MLSPSVKMDRCTMYRGSKFSTLLSSKMNYPQYVAQLCLLSVFLVSYVFYHTALAKFDKKKLVMCKVYTNVGGIK